MNNAGVCSIQMNGEELQLLYGMPACEYFQRKIVDGSVMVDEEGNTIGTTGIAFLVNAGYWNHCIANGVVPKKKIGDFITWIEEVVDDEQVQRSLLTAAECFRDSKAVAKQMDRTEKLVAELKKKTTELTGMKSSPSVLENSGSV